MTATETDSEEFSRRCAEVFKLRKELLDEFISRKVGSPRTHGDTPVTTTGLLRDRLPEESKALLRQKFKDMLDLEKAIYKEPDIVEVPPADEKGELVSITLETVVPSAEERNARAVVLIVRKDLLPFDETSRTYRFAETLTAREFFHLCAGELFANQITARGEGTGFLVGPRSILTAAHCVDERWQDLYFVFDFHLEKNGQARTVFGEDDVYEAEKILKKDSTLPADWALMRLKREVVGREPVLLRKSGRIRKGDPVYVIGHPLTLPKKKSKGGTVRFNRSRVTFTANVDVFGGNSGSPVFNQKTHEVEGLLVDGSVDLVRCPACAPACRKARVCPDNGCVGEIATRITEVLKIVGEEDLV